MTHSLAATIFGDRTVPHDRPVARLLDLSGDEAAALRALVERLDAALGRRRLEVSRSTLLLEEGEEVGGLFVVVEGIVALSRPSGRGEVLHHTASTGPIVGLSALLAGTTARFTCRAATDAVVVPVSFDELDELLTDPATAGVIVTLLVWSLARRQERSIELTHQVEVLNQALQTERDQLADTVDELDVAQQAVVDAARMATLGELAAGVAHELNNPAAALGRAVDHAVADVIRLVEGVAGSVDLVGDVDLVGHLRRSRGAPPLGTAERRRRCRALAALHGDGLAERMVEAGIDDEVMDALMALDSRRRDRALDLLSIAWSLGGWTRNLDTATGRVADLAASLRNYARPDSAPVDRIDLIGQLDDTLRLYEHRLAGVNVERRWDAQEVEIAGWPAALLQVWSNLIANAADALEGAGTLEVSVERAADDRVVVTVTDDGPGIPTHLLERIFEPRFTTKAGRVEFGLGLGLGLARQAVDRHGGELGIESEPGRTRATVSLPVRPVRSPRRPEGAG